MTVGISITTLEDLKKYPNIRVVQMFLFENNWKYKLTPDDETIIQKSDIDFYCHSVFTTSLVKLQSLKILIDQYMAVDRLNFKGLVVHLPSEPTSKIYSVLHSFFESLSKRDIINYPVIYFEHVPKKKMARSSYADVNQFIKALVMIKSIKDIYNDKIPVGFCVDTCHVYVSGINFSDSSVVQYYMNRIKSTNLPILVHLNDSSEALGSSLDRHAPIGTTIWCNSLEIPDKLTNEYTCILELIDPSSSLEILNPSVNRS